MTSSLETADRPIHGSQTPALAPSLIVALTSGVWGLGFSRFLAEATLWPLLYASPLAVGGLVLVCAAAGLGVWRLALCPRCADAWEGWSSLIPLFLSLPYVTGLFPQPLTGGTLLLGGVALAILLAWRDRPRLVIPGAISALALGLYLRTLLPSVGRADTFEFQVVVPQLGLAHPTGYPLYVLLGKLFTYLPVRGVGWRVNLTSAVFAVGAVLVLYALVRRLTARPLASLLVALAFAFSATFWSQAVVAEVYTLHLLLVAGILLLLLPPREDREEAGDRRGLRWKAAFFLLGLSLTNHLTTALLVPVVVLALLWDRPRLRAGDWVGAAMLFLLGLTPYLYLPLRWPVLHDGTRLTLRGFLEYVTGGQFHGALHLAGWRDPGRWQIVGRLLLQPYGWGGVALATVGVAGWALRRRRELMITGVTFLVFVVYGLTYYVADIAVFLLPTYLLLAVWMGAGVAVLAQAISSVVPSGSVGFRVGRASVVTLLAFLSLSRIWINLPKVDRSDDWEGYVWGRYVLRQPLAEGSAILAEPSKFAPLYYLQHIEGARPDLDIVVLGTEELYQADLRRRLAEGQIVYLARYLPHLDGLYLRSVGPLAEVRAAIPSDTSVPDDETRSASLGAVRQAEDTVRLVGAELQLDPLGRRLYHLTLRWQAVRRLEGDFVVRLRLLDASGEMAWQTDGVRPVNGLYPTNAWPAGATVSDYHAVPVEPWLRPGTYALEAALFSRLGGDGLAKVGEASPWLSVGTLGAEALRDPEPLPGGPILGLGDGVWLVGRDVPEQAAAGSPVTVELAWRGLEANHGVRFSWADGQRLGLGMQVFRLAPGMVRSRHTIAAPVEPGAYTLRAGLTGHAGRCGWLGAPQQSCPLGRVSVSSGEEGLATFGDRVRLIEAQVRKSEAQPGETIPVTLRWRGLRAMGVDFTVFVHLVGPDGRLHGQEDSWPMQGTYPTSQWRPGQDVVDEYEVRLEPDAPSGRYGVEVGLYRLETMHRLPVVDAEGQSVADSFLAGTFDARE